MQLFRHLGLEDRVREAGASLSPNIGIYSGPSLKKCLETKPRTETTRKFPFTGSLASISPTTGTFVTQDMIEPVLVDVARERGRVEFKMECISVEQDDSGVLATLKSRHSGMTYTVRADYLIAADGVGSPI